MPRKIDLMCVRFGRLRVVGDLLPNRWGVSQWMCHCDCGKDIIVSTGHLKAGSTKSCGCFQAEIQQRSHPRHGQSTISCVTAEYRAWHNMKQRCLNPNSTGHENYGGRGITVCDRWLNFENFFEDMGCRPSPKWSIDRIDNDGNYEPGNVRWATRFQQTHNRRAKVLV